jgi:hypothetical protein
MVGATAMSAFTMSFARALAASTRFAAPPSAWGLFSLHLPLEYYHFRRTRSRLYGIEMLALSLFIPKNCATDVIGRVATHPFYFLNLPFLLLVTSCPVSIHNLFAYTILGLGFHSF